MKLVTLQELVAAAPARLHAALTSAKHLDKVEGYALDTDGKVTGLTKVPKEWPDSIVLVWLKHPPKLPAAGSRTQAALALVEAGTPVKDAAQQCDVDPAAVYRAIGRRKGKNICPCCNQIIRAEFSPAAEAAS